METQLWVLSRYEKLWSIFGNKRFTREEALESFKRIEGDAFSEESLKWFIEGYTNTGYSAVNYKLKKFNKNAYIYVNI